MHEELEDTRRKLQKLARASAPRPMTNRFVSSPRGWGERRRLAMRPTTPPSYDWRSAPPDAWAHAVRADDAAFYLKSLVGTAAAESLPGDLLETLAQLSWARAVCADVAEGGASSSASLVLRGVGSMTFENCHSIGVPLAKAFDVPWGLSSAFDLPMEHWDDPESCTSSLDGVVTLEGPGAERWPRRKPGPTLTSATTTASVSCRRSRCPRPSPTPPARW